MTPRSPKTDKAKLNYDGLKNAITTSKPPKEKNDEPPESNSPSTPVSIGPPPEKVTRKRAAAVIAVAANADIITPRATSPRKRANNNNPQTATPLDEAPPDEPTYCTCKQVSFGDMICCDNNKCPIEWFHFGCVNIKVKPTKGKKWFCPDCRHGDKQTVLKPSLMKK
uniref:Zinc finger PHD-type domain-containing protein n=1 Tax=Acrobeloides nanus TaxID=290746 RepID=A0A914DSJ1_9BILA